MTSAASLECFDGIEACANCLGSLRDRLRVFMLPRWMQTWRQAFKPDDELYVCLIRMGNEVMGVVPLSINGTMASFVGCADVCDYLDFAVESGHEKEFYSALLDNLEERHITELDLRCLRPESTVLSHLAAIVQERGGVCSIERDGVSLEMDLPGDWNEYLNMLNGQQRHEIRRKLRRLSEKADVRFVIMENPVEITDQLDCFLKMFRESRTDKAAFMTPQMESFFRLMIRAMSEEGIIKLFLLKLNDSPAATVLCFDYYGTMYLYISGYDPRYGSLSVGLLCKILSIEHSIKLGRKKYDFLKGTEPYKYRLGGKEVPLSRCRITLK